MRADELVLGAAAGAPRVTAMPDGSDAGRATDQPDRTGAFLFLA